METRVVRLRYIMLAVPLILAGHLSAVPPAPTQVSPPDSSTVQTLTPTLEVEHMSGVDLYNFRVIRNDSVMGTCYPDTNILTWPEDLKDSCTYQWICRAHDATGWGQFCGRWTFFLQLPAPPPPPTPQTPANGSQVDTTSPQLRVQPVPGAVEYNFDVFYDGNLVRSQLMPVPYVYVNPPLPNDLDYQWTCAARNNVGWGQPFEPYWGFTVKQPTLPPAPTQWLPIDGDTIDTPRPELVVEVIPDAIQYNFRVIRNDSVIGTCYPSVNHVTWPEDLEEGCTYQWICRAQNSVGWGYFCDPWSFTIRSNGVEERATSREAQPSLVSCEVEPNPFSTRTSVKYTVPLSSHVSLRVLSPAGGVVRTLHEGYVAAGTYTTAWNGLDDSGSPVGKGVYFCCLVSGSQVSLRKLVRLE